MTITANTARDVLARLDLYGTPAAAAHQCDVELTAIAPYTSRDLEASRAALRWLDRRRSRLEHHREVLREYASR